ncbi:MAG: EcsC family protein [Snowella sp.]|nr:EcsC family protein [Snowella sp.]
MATSNDRVFQDFLAFTEKSSQIFSNTMKNASSMAEDTLNSTFYTLLHEGTEKLGDAVTPIATHPAIQFATKLPGLSWVMAALGQVNMDAVQQEIDVLRRDYPRETQQELAQRVIADTTLKAAGIGLVTNIIPPLALTLLAVDLGAIAALQAEMIYRIAAIYGFSPTDPARRGEVLALWGLSMGSSGVVKSGLSIVEGIPIVGAAVGTAGNATILYGLGQMACRFYEFKQKGHVNV